MPLLGVAMPNYPTENTYTLEDLKSWTSTGTSLAVLGFPVRHSISPAMHNAALSVMAKADPKFADWKYYRFEIQPEDIPEALPVFHDKGFLGLNLTIPHKTIAMDCIEKIDQQAKEIGAVNTLKKVESGYKGYNTDGYGMAEGIRIELDTQLKGQDVVILGAGGASRAAAVQCLRSQCNSLLLLNRNPDRLDALMKDIEPIASETGIDLQAHSTKNDFPDLPSSPLIINCTSLGLKKEDPCPLEESRIPKSSTAFDMIYNPSETAFMNIVSKKEGKSANGLSMLVYQGVKALEIWSETTVPAQAMVDAAQSTQ